jgi:hypothetical protein
MTPASVAAKETPMKCGQKRSPDGHAASAITMKNNAEQQNMPTCPFSRLSALTCSELPRAHEKTRCGVPPGRLAQLWMMRILYKIR